MATKRGKELTAKKLVLRENKKAKRYARRWNARVVMMETDFAARKIAAEEAAKQPNP